MLFFLYEEGPFDLNFSGLLPARHLTGALPFSLPGHSVWRAFLLSLSSWGNRGTKRFNDLLKVTLTVSSGATFKP